MATAAADPTRDPHRLMQKASFGDDGAQMDFRAGGVMMLLPDHNLPDIGLARGGSTSPSASPGSPNRPPEPGSSEMQPGGPAAPDPNPPQPDQQGAPNR